MTQDVAVLGIGIMGSAMARNLLAAGLSTTVWDRSADATAPLAQAGATAATSPTAAVSDARVVITMLPTVEIVDEVIFDGGVAAAFAEGTAWAQMGTIGVTQTQQAAARLGQAGQGSKLKLAVNAYMSTLIEGVAEALELAKRLGIDPSSLADAIEGGPLDAPIADAKLYKMEQSDYAPEFPLEWALKDVDLALAAVGGGDDLPLFAALSRQWHAAVSAGYGRSDVSAAALALGHHS